jgi:hypothetical protein
MGSFVRACARFVSVATVQSRLRGLIAWARLAPFGVALVLAASGCGDQGFFPTTVDPGADYALADIVFDENYFYCKVEPVLFGNSCGNGDSSKGDTVGGCHFSATVYRLTDYMPRVGDSCNGGSVPMRKDFPDAARNNYRSSQAHMKRDPELAPLLQRPTQNQVHPRKIFEIGSMDADAIRQWATQFSNQ